jgi:citrate lyase beta subunit
MGPSLSTRPLHVLYGGAHLYARSLPEKLAQKALAALDAFGGDVAQFATTLGSSDPSLAVRVRKKLSQAAVESLCIDFEDGYGQRSDQEEDAEAKRAASELRAGASTRVGIRIKAFTERTRRRAERTLEVFLDALGTPPPGFTVTLPKVTSPSEVEALAKKIPSIDLELMIETPAAVLAPRALVDAGGGRVVAVHLGAYDLTAELGVTARDQSLAHPYNELARMMLKLHLPDVGVADGATTLMPVGTHEEVHRAWALHAANIRHAIKLGIWQGWDLHPAQLPARWGAVFASFLDGREAMAKRLAAFRAKREQASRVGQEFDDMATARAIETFFERAVACGALDPSELP